MAHSHGSFIPAAGHDWLLPLYDPFARLLGSEAVLEELVAQAGPLAGRRVLDVGCGTGNLSLLVKRSHPDAEVIGSDPDPKALALAERKARRASLELRFEEGFAQALPSGDASFDVAFSSFMIHHLPDELKGEVFREVRRVLVPGGAFHLLDFVRSERRTLLSLFHANDAMHTEAQLLGWLADAGFDAEKTAEARAMFGHAARFRAIGSG